MASTSGALSSRAHLIVGFALGGVALVALADVAPEAAIGLASVLALGVALTHASEIQQLSNAFITATGHQPVK